MSEHTPLTMSHTPFLRAGARGLEQLLRVTAWREHSGSGRLSVALPDGVLTVPVELPAGESTHEVYLPERRTAVDARVTLAVSDAVETAEARLPAARRWTVHVVQTSHHDVGYTDLPSRVVALHDRWLDQAIDFAQATRAYPEAARFRMVIEQAWSLEHFLQTATEPRRTALLDLIRAGDVEMTALFGNLTTELCGHETLVRALYPAFDLKRRHGLPLCSAEHNDIPGLAWGAIEALAGAGVRLLCLGVPYYWNWGAEGTPYPFWDETAIQGGAYLPAAFRWEAPSGARLLCWVGGTGCGGDCRTAMPRLARRLADLDASAYPLDVLRWVVQGGSCDNSPYTMAYSDTIRDWNARWAWPRLESSTNARFLADLEPCLGSDVRVIRGDFPGQDYPLAAMSTARATAVARTAQADLPAAETLDTLASLATGSASQTATCAEGYAAALWHDEHTWGHHFPAGAGAVGSALEKAAHAYRAEAVAQDVADGALAGVVDRVQVAEAGHYLLVANSLAHARTALVSTPLREFDSCRTTMVAVPPEDDPQGVGFLRGLQMPTRNHALLPAAFADGMFVLRDAETGAIIPHALLDIDSPAAPVPYAAHRVGLGSGAKRLGMFDRPQALRRELRFLADLPAAGYRTYRIEPADEAPVYTGARRDGDTLANDAFRCTVDPGTGAIASLRDLTTGAELVDAAAPHPFGVPMLAGPSGDTLVAEHAGTAHMTTEGLPASIVSEFRFPGTRMAAVRTITLVAGLSRVEIAVWVLMDGTPLQELLLPFPFALPGAQAWVEGPLAVARPVRDFVPGAFADRLAVRDWVHLAGETTGVTWIGHDTPMVSLGRLWPGRVSPAHAAVPVPSHPPQTAEAMRGGHLYAVLAANNFGTNFMVTQDGGLLMRFSLATGAPGDLVAAAASARNAAVRPRTLLAERRPGGDLPCAASWLSIDSPAVHLLSVKPAADARGFVLRVWNIGNTDVSAVVRLAGRCIVRASRCTLVEEEIGEDVPVDGDAMTLALGPGEVATLRVTCR